MAEFLHRHQPTVLVTSSPFKMKMASRHGIPSENDNLKIKRVGDGEFNHDKENGNGLVVSFSPDEIPYSLKVARAKLEALITHGHKNGRNHVVADSTWVVEGKNGDCLALNKPVNEHRLEKLCRLFYKLRGQDISTDTGWGVVSPDLKQTWLYYARLKLGKVGDFDPGILEQMARANSDISAGGKFEDMMSVVIKPSRFAEYEVIQYPTKPDLIVAGKDGELVRKVFISQDREATPLSFDGTNYEALKYMSLGFPGIGDRLHSK